MCSCEGYEADTKSDQYDQVFSGLILSAERVNEPVTALVEVGPNLVLDPGFWIKSKILVLRVWRGAPSTTAEVWTPVVTDCDTPPMPGLYFMALVRTKEGRSVAERAYCNCDEAALTAGGGTLVLTNVVILAAAIGVVGIALVLLLRQFRRSRR